MDVRRPDRVALPPNLLADQAVLDQTQTVTGDDLRIAAQALLEQVQPTLNFEQGDVTMLVMDMPDVPPQYAPVLIAQASLSQRGSAVFDRTIGVCQPVENPIRVLDSGKYSAVNAIGPEGAVENYLWAYEKIRAKDPITATILILLCY